MYKYLNLALIFSVSLFVNTAHAATGLTSIDYDYGTLTPTQSSITFSDATSSDYDFLLPVDGQIKYYKYTYSKPSSYSTSTFSSYYYQSGSQSNVLYQNSRGLLVHRNGGSLYIDFVDNPDGSGSHGNGKFYLESVSKDIPYFVGAFINNGQYGFIRTHQWDVGRSGGRINNLIGDFIKNQSTAVTNPGDMTYGGAMQINTPVGNIIGNFIANVSRDYGGAITLFNNQPSGYAYTTIDSISNSTFIGNTAGIYGGAIYSVPDAGDGTGRGVLISRISNTVFYGNTDSTGYNDIYNVDGTIGLSTPTGTSVNFGGSVTGSNGTLYINNDSTASNRGGQYIFNNTVSGNRFNLYSFGAIC